MIEGEPTREEAVRSLTEVKVRASQLQKADWELRAMLAAIIAVYLGVAALMSVIGRGGSALGAVAVVAMVAAGLIFIVVAALRVRAYSRRGIMLFLGTLVAFNVWNSLVTSLSIGTRFWAQGQPSYHFGVSELVGTIPLVVGVWLFSRGRG